MNAEKLSYRLETVAKYIPAGFKFADIGSDHAYLPCHVVKKGSVPFAIAGEVAEGPYQSALNQVLSEGLSDKIQVRKGDGLEVIHEGEVDCITIAGMGGTLISSILEQGKEKLGSVRRLVLQPNIGAIQIRKWLIENRWKLINEEIIKEGDKIYEILIAERGDPLEPYGEKAISELLLGPFLLKECNDVFKEKWLGEKKNWERVLKQLDMAEDHTGTEKKKMELLNKISMVEETLDK